MTTLTTLLSQASAPGEGVMNEVKNLVDEGGAYLEA